LNRYSTRRILDWLKNSTFPPVVDSSSTYVTGGLETVPWEGAPAPEYYDEDIPEDGAEGGTDE
ncbi:MAG: hypothetical protein RQ748_10120, partial [Elusimicrobiales bacterium]|nr:hypothetical protein [Elusimicrobiales bacterium]